MYSTGSTWVKHRKIYYFMGRRRWLPMDHLLRKNRRTFDGKQELECAPEVPSGDEILRQLEGMVFGDESAGKTPDPTESKKKGHKKKKKKIISQWPLRYCGKRKVFFLGSCIGKIIC
jgi:hypothetical protein